MTDYEIQQLQLSQQILDKLGQIQVNVISVTDSVYELSEKVSHLSDQADLTHITMYSIGVYISIGVISSMLCAALIMFLVGYKVSRGS
jgi:hypothetical protein